MSTGVDTASGKSQATENFPVASWLITPAFRPAIHAFYRFARTADDIADHPQMEAQEKLERLDHLVQALSGTSSEPICDDLIREAGQLGVSLVHALDLLDAFRLDVTKRRYVDWDDLIAYCAKSAMPVGRYVLDVHGEDRATWGPSDSLCAALQVINHLQDCADDFIELDRVYVPVAELGQFGETPAALCARSSSPALRQVFNHLLDRTQTLLDHSRALAPMISDYRLRMEVSVIQSVAERLVGKLRRQDPLQTRVKLSAIGYVSALGHGIFNGLFARRSMP